MERELSRQIFENTRISDFMKIHPVVAELFHVDGQPNPTKLATVALSNFANTPDKK
jgi:hypothetical protein